MKITTVMNLSSMTLKILMNIPRMKDEEKYYLPQNKFITMNFDIITDKIKEYKPEDFEKQTQEDVLLALLNHPYGDSKWLDKAYEILYRAIDARHQIHVDAAKQRLPWRFLAKTSSFNSKTARNAVLSVLTKSLKPVHTSIDAIRACGGVCADCGPFIPNKCPMCNVKKPMRIVSLNKIRQLAENQLYLPRQTVRPTLGLDYV